MKRFVWLFMFLCFAGTLFAQQAPEKDRLFVHMQSGLDKDDAKICVAYNIIWAGLKSGMAVDVLVDADAIMTFKEGRFSDNDAIQEYKIPQNLRKAMADQFSISLDKVPLTYGDFLKILHQDGAKFYINKGFLIVSKIAPEPDKNLGKISKYAAKIFKPISLLEMIQLRKKALFDYTF